MEEEGWAVVGAGWTGYELNPEWSWQSVIDPFSVSSPYIYHGVAVNDLVTV